MALARGETPALVSATHARPSVEPVPRIEEGAGSEETKEEASRHSAA